MKVKLNGNATLPKKAHPSDAGYDLVATGRTRIGNILTYETDIAVEIPKGHVGLLFPRSSVYKYDLELCNSVGVIDENFRGTIKAKFREIPTKDLIAKPKIYDIGDCVCQLVIVPIYSEELEVVDSLDKSYRGSDGFGSSGV